MSPPTSNLKPLSGEDVESDPGQISANHLDVERQPTDLLQHIIAELSAEIAWLKTKLVRRDAENAVVRRISNAAFKI